MKISDETKAALDGQIDEIREVLSDPIPPEHYDAISQVAILIPSGQSEQFYIGVALGLRLAATSIENLPVSLARTSLAGFVAADAIRYQEATKEENWSLE